MAPTQHPTRRQAMQLTLGTMAMAALPVPALARLQAVAGATGPIIPMELRVNVLWKPVDDAPRGWAAFDDRWGPDTGA